MDMNKLGSLYAQGDILGALAYIEELGDLNEELIQMKKKYRERFITQTEEIHIEIEDVWIKGVLSAYYAYYRKVLTGNPIESTEEGLIQSLLPYVKLEEGVGIEEIEKVLCETFRQKGYSFLGGRTLPYLGPYIWKTTHKKAFDVKLVDSHQRVTVYFISDFLMLSWMHFATFGRSYTGGWAKEEGLYCIDNGAEMSDITSEDFQVRYLKHEAQHLSDYKEFPNLKPWELEYRAKCVELIYYSKSHELLVKILNQAKADERFPHAYAAYKIVEGLSSIILNKEYVIDQELWKNILDSEIRVGVLKLFQEDTGQRQVQLG